MVEAIRRSGLHEAIIYVQISRGVAVRKHAFPDPPVEPTELIVVLPYDDGPTAALRKTGVAVVSQPDLRWKRCDIKSVNLLGNVLANQAAHEAGAYEAVLVDDAGHVTEATHSSLLWVREGALFATGEGREILPGTTRGFMLELAQECNVSFRTERIGLERLMECDEVILTGTTIEVMPVVEIDGRRVGGVVPGPVTGRLQLAFTSRLNRWLEGAAG
jgi:D-alanine transaminase